MDKDNPLSSMTSDMLHVLRPPSVDKDNRVSSNDYSTIGHNCTFEEKSSEIKGKYTWAGD